LKNITHPFIITLTGSSLSGKSYVMEKIVEASEMLRVDGISFAPVPIPKYTTRTYREEDIKKKHSGKFVDVIPVDEVPEACDLVYRTYGKDYGLKITDLQSELDAQNTPIVVINDIRAVEELKSLFPGRVLSLYLFRRIPNVKDYERAKEERGNVQNQEYLDRYNKAISMYRIYIENIAVFDRVILNVKNYKGDPGEIDYTKLQIINTLRGVFEGKIKLAKRVTKSPRLFIISGGPVSGKDDIIQAVKRMGKLQASILPKFTSRRQADDDGDEMICQFVPRRDITSQYETEYNEKYDALLQKYDVPFDNAFSSECEEAYKSSGITEPFLDYCEVQWEIRKLNELRALAKPLDVFWRTVSETLKKQRESVVLSNLFQTNEAYVIDLEQLPKPLGTSKAWEVSFDYSDYIIYGNNKSIRYGFAVSDLKSRMMEDNKHIVLVASLPEIFRICKKRLGRGKVVPIYAYSQIEKDDFLEAVDATMAEMKLENLDDLIRYSEHIVEFDHVLIYATTSLKNSESGVKEELIDQMFRLFRAY